MILDINKVDNSWRKFLTSKTIDELNAIESYIGDNYTPPEDKVLRFMQIDLSKIKVVILGQDPYKPAGVANGRSFQPNDLVSWNQTFRQVSLKNIIRNIYACYTNIERYVDIPEFSSIAGKVVYGEFGIKQPQEWFDSLEEQGVLFLNTSLTCRIGVSNSHKGIWFEFSHKLINYISEERPDLIWFLWGKEAAIYDMHIKSGTKYISRHPMMCSEAYEDDFLRNPCFKNTMNIINWLG